MTDGFQIKKKRDIWGIYTNQRYRANNGANITCRQYYTIMYKMYNADVTIVSV